MSDTDAKYIIDLQNDLNTQRQPFERVWSEISRYVDPNLYGFDVKSVKAGVNDTREKYDSTATTAAERLGAMLVSWMCPEGELWHDLEALDPQINDNVEAKQWFYLETKGLFADRYAVSANFAGQNACTLYSAGLMGTGTLFIGEDPQGGMRYLSIPLAQSYYLSDDYNRVYGHNRRFEMEAHKLVKRFGDKTPEKIRNIADRQPNQKFWFIHSVMPNESYKEGLADQRGMKLSSIYVFEDGQEVVERGGFNTMPYAPARFNPIAGEAYGRSSVWAVIADIKMKSQAKKDYIDFSQKSLRPTLLAFSDGVLGNKLQIKPNSVVVGGLNASGQQLVKPMENGGMPAMAKDVMQDATDAINDGLFVTLFKAVMDRPDMNMLQVSESIKERAHLLGPSLGRFQNEYFGAIIERELDVRARQGRMTPLPRILQEGGEYKVRYLSQLNRIMKAGEVSGIMHTIQGLKELMQIEPDLRYRLDTHKILEKMADANGAADVLLSKEQAAELVNQAQQQQQALAGLQAAPGLGRAARDLAEAQQIEQGGAI